MAACRPLAAPPTPEPAAHRFAIVASERGPHGAHLVAIDERGDRQAVLVRDPAGFARDTNPAISPDGTRIAFASSRDRALDETSLWIASLDIESEPEPLTDHAAIDSHPVWTSDGTAIVFASTRGGHGFDLWRLTLATHALEQLTSTEGHEITPTIARDGTILYAKVTVRPDGSIESHLETRAPNGTIAKLTDGPADTTPAFAPDGATLAFARPVAHGSAVDAELFTMPRAGGVATQLVDVPLTDESGPRWSPDGRYVFATSVLRGEHGATLFSSILFVDVRRPIARMLEDRAGPVARLTPALAGGALDGDALAHDPEYLPELGRIMAQVIADQQHQGRE